MLATISPSSTVIDETINTLRYAGLASTITNVPRIRTPHLRHEIDELREENARLKQELFLVKSKSMPSIHQATASKISLMNIDEGVQTSFRTIPEVEEVNNDDEQLDTVDDEVSNPLFECDLLKEICGFRFSQKLKVNVDDRNENVYPNNLCMKSVYSHSNHLFLIASCFFLQRKFVRLMIQCFIDDWARSSAMSPMIFR